MSLKVNAKRFCLACIWGVVTLIEAIICSKMSWCQNDIVMIATMIIINLSMQLICLAKCKQPLFSFFAVLVVFLYLFHFGQIMLTAFFPHVQFDIANYLDHYATNKVLAWKSIVVSVICINCIYVGGLLTLRSPENTQKTGSKYVLDMQSKQMISYRICYFMGRFLFFLAIPFRLYIDIRQLLTAMTLGYVGVYSLVSIGGVFSAIAKFFYISIPLIYLTTKNKTKRNVFLLICLVYMVITMFTGNRGHQVTNIIGIFLVVYIDSGKKIRFGQLILYSIAGFFGLSFLDMIFSIRHSGIEYFLGNFSTVLAETMEKNILLETLNNFGATIFTPYLVLERVGQTIDPFFGEAFVKSIASIIPDIGDVFSEINRGAIFSQNLNTQHQIGGSLVGEFYYNFRSAYWVAGIIFGMLYGSISSKIHNAILVKDYAILCTTLPLAVYSLWWVRDTIGGVTRPIVWLYIIYVFMSRLTLVRSAIQKSNKYERNQI